MDSRLLYPNQFIIGPNFPDLPDFLQKVELAPKVRISAHPSLSITRASSGNHELVLLGFMIDSSRPLSGDQQIVDELVGLLDDEQALYQRCSALAGRWVLIYSNGSTYKLINDAAGLRQIFYTDLNFSNDLWIASQPRILAELKGFHIDHRAAEFIDSDEFRSHTEFRFPVSKTPYKEIKHLLPNHSLDLAIGQCHRFWPSGPIDQVSMNEAVIKCSTMLEGLMQAAVNRFDLAVSLTAGLDSRVVLAACRDIRDKITVMTVRQIDKVDQHADVVTAGQILSMVNLPHDVIKSSLLVDDDFLSNFKNNTTLPHFIYLSDAQAILRRYQRRKVVATGSVSEVGRMSFRAQLGKPETEEITAFDLAKLQKMGKQPFAVDAFGEWIDNLCDSCTIPVLDLFEWEQGHGCWLAMSQLEFDIAWRDLFTPFNCRDLLTTLLGVDARYRSKPNYTLYQEIIRHLWPELLNVPINPHEKTALNFTRLMKSKIPYPIKKYTKKILKR